MKLLLTWRPGASPARQGEAEGAVVSVCGGGGGRRPLQTHTLGPAPALHRQAVLALFVAGHTTGWGRQMGSPARAIGQNTLRPILQACTSPQVPSLLSSCPTKTSLLPKCSFHPTCHSMSSPKFSVPGRLPRQNKDLSHIIIMPLWLQGTSLLCNIPPKYKNPLPPIITLPKKLSPGTLPFHLTSAFEALFVDAQDLK